ncbi:MAG: transporter substrate-binding domain-containing protein [Ruminococcus sp.]|nr:transporter substrate-binding domain-containing protein [Ruminococcus sp.]
MKKSISIFSAFVFAVTCLCGCGADKKEPVILCADDLKGKSIGTQTGTTGYLLANDIEDAKVEKYKDAETAVKALSDRKIDAVIIDRLTAQELVEENGKLEILRQPLSEEEYAIAYKKGNDELGEKLNSAIQNLKDDGTLEIISRHWIGKNPDHKPYQPDNNITRNGTLIMATNAEFPPYESVENGEIVGFDIDMANAICDELGMELKIQNIDFNAVITSISLDESDVGIAGMSVTTERSEIVDFTQSYATSSQVIIVRSE